jgi:hypothetical protein
MDVEIPESWPAFLRQFTGFSTPEAVGMIGTIAFCPKTGAQLSEERYYDEHGRALRVPIEDAFVAGDNLDGELTTGAVRSSQRALLVHFRRTHQFHRPENADLYRNVALWLRQLKQTASDPQTPDMVVWLALSARVRREGYDAEWMLSHVALRCPRCHGRLTYEQLGPDALSASCGTNCTDDNANRLTEIENLAADLYAQTFERGQIEERAEDEENGMQVSDLEILESRHLTVYPRDRDQLLRLSTVAPGRGR